MCHPFHNCPFFNALRKSHVEHKCPESRGELPQKGNKENSEMFKVGEKLFEVGATAAVLSLRGCLEYITQSAECCDVAPISTALLQHQEVSS